LSELGAEFGGFHGGSWDRRGGCDPTNSDSHELRFCK
jgi:hypothetical protein